MSKPVRVFIDSRELIGYTSLSLQRSKDQMTGSLTISIFMGWIPKGPLEFDAGKGQSITIYIGGHLAFNGVIDSRVGQGTRSGEYDSTRSLTIGADEYTVTFTARGKTKYLIDSSHQHPTGTMIRPTNRDVFEKLLEPWGIDLVWEADVIDLDRIRFRDGGRVVDEIRRIAAQCSLYVYEDVQGRMNVSDKVGTVTGEPIVLGRNILSFSTDQSEGSERSQITVKGQLTSPESWGESAVIPTIKTVKDSVVESFIPIVVQLFGNATPELIDRRIQYEANKRTSKSKKVTVEMFHVQQTDGRPWDIGGLHLVSIPPDGVNDLMEITDLTYNVGINSLTTTITLSPPPAKAKSNGDGPRGILSDVPERNGESLPPSAGLSEQTWGACNISEVENGTNVGTSSSSAAILNDVTTAPPPLNIRGPQ